MAQPHLITTPILRSNPQLLVLPVNTEGTILDTVVARCKTLYPENYQVYRKQCLDGELATGTSLLIKRQRQTLGLSASSNANRLTHIANLAVTDHPYHTPRMRWLKSALQALYDQSYQLMRYDGLRHLSFWAKPLISQNTTPRPDDFPALDWQTQILPLIQQTFEPLPKVRVEIYL